MDLMPTCIELAGASYDSETYVPLAGLSLVPVMQGQNLPKSRELGFEHHGNRALRVGRYKLVARQNESDEQWHLFDMQLDRTETQDLAEELPQVVEDLKSRWHQWAEKVGVRPWPVKRRQR